MVDVGNRGFGTSGMPCWGAHSAENDWKVMRQSVFGFNPSPLPRPSLMLAPRYIVEISPQIREGDAFLSSSELLHLRLLHQSFWGSGTKQSGCARIA
jgi:hypothetical protein